jgi:hypothetical protein
LGLWGVGGCWRVEAEFGAGIAAPFAFQQMLTESFHTASPALGSTMAATRIAAVNLNRSAFLRFGY